MSVILGAFLENEIIYLWYSPDWLFFWNVSVFSLHNTPCSVSGRIFLRESIREHRPPVWMHIHLLYSLPWGLKQLFFTQQEGGQSSEYGCWGSGISHPWLMWGGFPDCAVPSSLHCCALSSLGGWLLWQDASVQWINCKWMLGFCRGTFLASFCDFPPPNFLFLVSSDMLQKIYENQIL